MQSIIGINLSFFMHSSWRNDFMKSRCFSEESYNKLATFRNLDSLVEEGLHETIKH